MKTKTSRKFDSNASHTHHTNVSLFCSVNRKLSLPKMNSKNSKKKKKIFANSLTWDQFLFAHCSVCNCIVLRRSTSEINVCVFQIENFFAGTNYYYYCGMGAGSGITINCTPSLISDIYLRNFLSVCTAHGRCICSKNKKKFSMG